MRSRVLRGGRGFVGPQGVRMGQENFPYHAGWGKNGLGPTLGLGQLGHCLGPPY